MLISRYLFFITKTALFFGGGLWGLAGAMYIGGNVLGFNSANGSLLLMIILAVIGTFLGCAASMFIFVFPMHFLFSNARKKLPWENTEPFFVYRFYQWYGQKLQEFGNAREIGKP